MKKLFLLLLGVLLTLPSFAFEYTYEGQTLSYEIIDWNAKTVSVYIGNVTGNLTIPAHPRYKYRDEDGTVHEVVCTSIEIHGDAFRYEDCSLTSVTIPNSVTSIGEYAFFRCSSLTSIEIPHSVIYIDDNAFAKCSSLTSVTIPNSVTFIGSYAFSGCSSLTSFEIPNSVTSIGSGAFAGCSSLTTFAIPNSITYIGYMSFSGCSSLTSLEIPNSVTYIDQFAFIYCSGLTSVTIPNSVTYIGVGAFYYCSGLTSVTIPNSVTYIGSMAFNGGKSMTSIYYNTTEPVEIFSDTFYSTTYWAATLYVPESAIETFKQTHHWDYFKNIQSYNFAGIEDITAGFDETAPCEFFSLSGVNMGSVRETLAPGVYIARQGSKTKKIVVK